MLKKNIIKPSDSRCTKETRQLNELTDHDAYPLPDIDDILSQLGNAKFFCALDLSSGFHQIPMDPESKIYTAFSTSQGPYHCNRMSFGLKIAPATLQRMINTALCELNKYCFAYFDDIIICAQSIEEHNQNLPVVLQRLIELGLKIQPDKCECLKSELEYLGHTVTAEGIKANPKKIEAVKNFNNRQSNRCKIIPGASKLLQKIYPQFCKISETTH